MLAGWMASPATAQRPISKAGSEAITSRDQCRAWSTTCKASDQHQSKSEPTPVFELGRLSGSETEGAGIEGAVAAILTVTIVMTLSHATVSMSGIGSLKCFVAGGIEKAC
jgi:hypothetical protein